MKPVQLAIAGLFAAFLVVRWRRLSTEGRVLLGLVAAALAVPGTGLVELPSLEKLIVGLAERLGQWTYLLVGFMAFAETGAFLGFVAPGEITVIVGGVVAGQGQIDIVTLIAIVWACAVLGDLTSYAVGKRLGRGFLERHGRRVKITPERLDKVEEFFERRGGATILVGRFIGLVRPIAPFLAGSTRMPLRRFLAYDVLAAGVWSATFSLLGFVFWHSFDTVSGYARRGALYLGAAAALGVGLVWLVRHRKDIRARLLRSRLGRPLVGPADFVWNRLTPGQLGLELTTLLAVAAVGAFVFVGYLVVLQDVVTTAGDRRAMAIADGLAAGWLLDAARAVTWLGAPLVTWGATLLAAGFLAARRRFLEALVLVLGLALTVLGVNVTKDGLGRERPDAAYVATEGFAYPSGHAAYSVAWVAIAVALNRAQPVLQRFAIPLVAVVIVVLVGLTRIYLRAHWLSDVLGGVGLAAASFALCAVVALVVDAVRHNETP